MEDIAPELLEKIKKDFEKTLEKSETIKAFREKVKKKTATYKDANDFAIEAGELLTDAFQSNLSKEILPDGKMYYNIADRIIRERLEHNYDITAEAAVEVQKILNEKAGIGIKAIKPEMNEDRVRGIINIVSGGKYEDVAYIHSIYRLSCYTSLHQEAETSLYASARKALSTLLSFRLKTL